VPEAIADLTPEASGLDDDPGATGARWLSLQRHLDETREEARSLVSAVSECTRLDPATLAAVIAAAALHDLGKAHSGWQEALLATAPAIDLANDLYAKSPGRGRLVVRDSGGERRPGFRHELVSVLMLSGDAGESAMEFEGVPEEAFELCRYLVGAHHGHLRLQPRDPLSEGRTGRTLLGLANGDQIPALPLGSGNLMDVNLSSFDGGPGSWTSSTLRLLADLGPFRLAYAEMLVRMADWRASAAIQLNAKEGS
jgi:CRISPR-associated endonuclease/helicase Cas3